ncbi:MAG: hypothetical protein ACJ790_05900 [Myxococcaceae bacterium]
MAGKVKDRSAPSKAPAKVGAAKPASAAAAPAKPAGPKTPAVLSQTSRMHKVQAAMSGDDEFSVFSVSPVGREKNPVDLKPAEKGAAEKTDGDNRFAKFFKGLVRG